MHTIVENICPKNSSRIPTKCQNFYRNILSKLIPNCLLYIFQLLRSNYCKIINKGKFECYIFLTFRHSSEKKINETWYTHILFNFRTIISFFYQPTKVIFQQLILYTYISKRIISGTVFQILKVFICMLMKKSTINLDNFKKKDQAPINLVKGS